MRFISRLLLALFLIGLTNQASAQSTCGSIAYGAVLTAGQWNACFAAKQNTLGYTPLSILGGTMQGELFLYPSSSSNSGLNLAPGSAPSAPSNGDIWTTSTGLYAEVGSKTIGPIVTAQQYSQEYGINGAITLTSAYAGTALVPYGSTPFAITLPVGSNCTSGNTFNFKSLGAAVFTVVSQGSDTIRMTNSSSLSSVLLYPGDTLQVFCTGNAGAVAYEVTGGTAELPYAGTRYISGGVTFTATGCSLSGITGGAAAGKFSSGTTGTCTVVININGAVGMVAPNGWSCYANDQTTPADLIHQTASSTTTATLSGTTVSGDVISFGCMGY